MDEFSTIFRQHLAEEIEALLGLTVYDSVQLLKLHKQAERKATTNGSKVSSDIRSHLLIKRVGG